MTPHSISITSCADVNSKSIRVHNEWFNKDFAYKVTAECIRFFRPELDYRGRIIHGNVNYFKSYQFTMLSDHLQDGRYWFVQEDEDYIEVYFDNEVISA